MASLKRNAIVPFGLSCMGKVPGESPRKWPHGEIPFELWTKHEACGNCPHACRRNPMFTTKRWQQGEIFEIRWTLTFITRSSDSLKPKYMNPLNKAKWKTKIQKMRKLSKTDWYLQVFRALFHHKPRKTSLKTVSWNAVCLSGDQCLKADIFKFLRFEERFRKALFRDRLVGSLSKWRPRTRVHRLVKK